MSGSGGEKPEIFDCVRLFEVGTSTSSTSASTGAGTAISIEHSCWRERAGHGVLVLVCSNGYLLVHVTLADKRPVVKQLKWFESREQHILAITLDPRAEWLACACLNGAIYLIPILSLILDCAPTHSLGSLTDITEVQPTQKKASPTSILWWETMDERHICITGSETGEVTFFNLTEKQDVATVILSGCIDTLFLAHQTDTSTHLLIGMRGGQWKRILLEEHFHEAEGTSYTEAQASGFEVLPDDVVVKSFLNKRETTDTFEVASFTDFTEMNELHTHDWKDQHVLGSLNLKTHRLEEYSYDFELQSSPLRVYQLVTRATEALLADRLIFVISHDDDVDPCSIHLSVMSSQRAQICELDESVSLAKSIIQQFTIPSLSNVVGFYLISMESHDLKNWTHDLVPSPTQLGGCVIVTTTAVFKCQQRLSPESLFLDLALSSKGNSRAQELGITLRLDVCGLYKLAAERKISEEQYSQALKLFELSRCPSAHLIDTFARLERVPELVQYLHQSLFDEAGHSGASPSNPKQFQDILMKCFVHQCLTLHDRPDSMVMRERFGQFINDKFQYNHQVAMEMLIKCGLKDQVFELAKAHRKLAEVLELLVNHGSIELNSSTLASLASRKYADTLEEAADGMFLYQLTPSTFVRLLIAMPSIIPQHLPHLRTLLPQADISSLLRLANLFDPSQPTIRPLLIKAHSNRHRSHSTGSLVSTVSAETGATDQKEHRGPCLEAYIETFLAILVVLNNKRRRKRSSLASLMSLSPLQSLPTSPRGPKLTGTFSDGLHWVRGNTVACGLHHAAMVMDGGLYTWGSTKNGKLGHGDVEEERKSVPLLVEMMSMLSVAVVSVSCGAEHTIAMCHEGIFSWGSSSHGQLGHGDTVKRTRPVQISLLADKGIVSVVCGQYHSLALDDDHRAWSWGWGVHGQLGLRSADDKLVPTHAVLLDGYHVSLVAAGYGHSAVLTAEGKVLTFGNGMYGQLGHGTTEKQSTPALVEALEDKTVYLLACGSFHTVAVSSDQCVFYWGKNLHRPSPATGPHGLKEYKRSRHGQSTTATTANTLTPQLVTGVEFDDTITQVSCGSFHSLLLTAAGSVYSWGSNVQGQLGHPHTVEMAQPKRVSSLDKQKLIAVAAGDEFSIGVEDKNVWAWGKADSAQLGLTTAVVKRSVYKPSSIAILKAALESGKHSMSRETSPDDAPDLPVLELDLGWELPDFAVIGPPHLPYGREALTSALEHLHGFYRASMVLWACQDWKDWYSMARIYDINRQWAQALECSMKSFAEGNVPAVGSITAVVEEYLVKLISDETRYYSPHFIRKGLHLMLTLLACWDRHGLEVSLLEGILLNHLTALAYPLSLILRSTSEAVPRTHGGFSFEFQLRVATEVIAQVSRGMPPPDETLADAQTEQNESDNPKPLMTESSPGDSRLWGEILRNLSKDLSKHTSVQIPESLLTSLRIKSQAPQERDASTPVQSLARSTAGFTAFSCGHAFPLSVFHSKILVEFIEHVQDFPVSIPHTLKHLQLHYKQASFYPSACPYCVFQYLRKVQLQECPGVPIRPWNP